MRISHSLALLRALVSKLRNISYKMINISYDKKQMLQDINVSKTVVCETLTEASDPAFVQQDQAYLAIKGKTPTELLPVLNDALTHRFSDVKHEYLFRNLLYPLKKAVGNAYKRGNHKDPDKWIYVEIIVTPKGAFVDVTDEGSGFDVQDILKKFLAGDKYFTHGGSGFKQFKKTKAVVSFANGGSTWRLRFLKDIEA